MGVESQGCMIPNKNIKNISMYTREGNKIKAECYANFILVWYLKFEIISEYKFLQY